MTPSSENADHNRGRQKGRNRNLLQEGKKLYMTGFQKQLQQMAENLDSYQHGSNIEAAQEIYRMLHTMKGSAPTFGFVRIGKVAEEVLAKWNWTQAEEVSTEELPFDLVKATKRAILQLKIEYEIGLNEVEFEDRTVPEESLVHDRQLFRLLLVDDDDALRSFLVKRLQLDGYQVGDAPDVATAKQKLHEQEYDLIILDLMMHPDSGYVLVDFLKDDPTFKWLPLVVLSGREDSKDKVRCYRLGADQYITKPFQYDELEAAIYRLLTRAQHFDQMAFRDPLTGVFNRRYFDHQLEIERKRMDRNGSPLSLAFIDIDRFKKINDIHGHHVGDLVLQGLGHILQKNLRATDLLARYGGEEFVVAFPDTTDQQAIYALEKILQTLRKEPIGHWAGLDLYITFSAGIAEWCGTSSTEEWIRQADDAMYEAKEQGRDRICIGTASVPSAHSKAAEWRILVADDDDTIRAILRAQLDHLAVEIMEASDGETALSMIVDQPPDLCIMDAVMPKLDGFRLLEFIRREPRLEKIKVLLLSGRKQEADLVRSMTLGADDYMSKPFSLVELEVRVKRLLDME